MIDLRFIDDISRRISGALPPGARELRHDMEKNVRAILHAGFEKLDLVTRDEFEIQARILEHTRSKLSELERQVVELEARLGSAQRP